MNPPTRRSTPGFTLIELLLVLAIVGLLMALVTPSFARVKAEAARTKTLANLRDSAAILAQYAADWRDSFPAFFDPRADRAYLRLASGQTIEVPGYFFSGLFWPQALTDQYFGGVRKPLSCYPARPPGANNPFLLPCALLAASEFWDLRTRTGPDQYRGVFHHEVMFPAAKSMLVSVNELFSDEEGRGRGPDPIGPLTSVPMATVDGSTRGTRQGEINPGVHTGDGPYRGMWHPMDVWAGLHTVGGARGRDIN